MSQFNAQLNEAASKNRELLTVLSQTDYAPPAHQQNAAYINDLQSQISATDKELKRLHDKTELEREDHVKYRDSVMKRFGHKLGGHKGEDKFKSKQEKEEREFLEAWQHEREAQERRGALGQALEQAENQQRTLAADKARHDQMQEELEKMYSSIFDGPTPDVPGEDEREQGVNKARDWFNQCQAQLGNEKHAAEALQRANQSLTAAYRDMDDARYSSDMDRFGGGALFDMMERDSLSKGQVKLSECLRAMDDARHAQPQVPVLSEVNIDNGHMMSDVLFDNIFTDMAQHDRIKDSIAQMQRAMDHLKSIVKEQEQRVQHAQDQYSQASHDLEKARKALQDTRSEAFERLAGSSVGRQDQSGPPPAY